MQVFSRNFKPMIEVVDPDPCICDLTAGDDNTEKRNPLSLKRPHRATFR